MSDKLIHFGVVRLNVEEIGKEPWKLVAECGMIVKEDGKEITGSITINLAEVTCPKCQEENAFKALQEFT